MSRVINREIQTSEVNKYIHLYFASCNAGEKRESSLTSSIFLWQSIVFEILVVIGSCFISNVAFLLCESSHGLI